MTDLLLQSIDPASSSDIPWQTFQKNCVKKLLTTVPVITSLQTLQDACDVWYYAVLYKKNYQYQDIILHAITIYQKFKVTNPVDAMIVWICYESLKVTQPEKSKAWVQKQDALVPVIKKNSMIYGYLLTHIIFYEMQFGKKSATQFCKTVFKELQELSSGYPYQGNFVDLLGEIIICYKLLKQNHDDWYKKTISWLKKQEQVTDFHTQAVLIIALS